MDNTVGSAITSARIRLRSTYKEKLNVLNGALADDAETVTFSDDMGGLTPGSYFGVDEELFFIRTKTGQQATVLRAQLGTTAAEHADGSVVEVRPKHAARGLLLNHLYEEIRSWGSNLFRIDQTTVVGAQDVRGYDTGLVDQTECLRVLQVTVAPLSGDTSAEWEPIPWDLMRRPPTTLAVAGNVAITIGSVMSEARDLNVEYAAPFDLSTFVASTDLVDDVGLVASMIDVAWLGACHRALSEVPRTEISGGAEGRSAEDVPAGQITAVRQDIFRDYTRRRAEESERLKLLYPPRGF